MMAWHTALSLNIGSCTATCRAAPANQGPPLLPSTCMHDVEQAIETQEGQARRREAFGSHLGIDHAVCSWVRQRTCRELIFGLPARYLCPGVHFEVYEDLQRHK